MRLSDRDTAARYRPDIDGLRAIAVALVIAYHAFPRLVPGGFIGVDVFFVISGFLITALILHDQGAGVFTLSAFYRRRVRRIAPALLLVLLVSCMVGWCVLLPGEFRALGQSLAWCAPFLANNYFARTGGYFDTTTALNPLLHLWSLGVEEQFYLAWPLLLLLACRYGATKRLLGAVIVLSLAFSLWSIHHSASTRFYLLGTRAWELGAGGMLATVRSQALTSARFAIIGLMLIGLGGSLLNSTLAFPGAWALVPVCGTLLLIAAGPENSINRHLLTGSFLTLTGRISYPLYLWHWPVLVFTRIALGRPPSPAMAAGLIVVSWAAAYLTYRLLEIPIRRGAFARSAVPTLLAGLACVAVVGWSMHARQVEGRLVGPGITALDQAIHDWHYPGGFNFGKPSEFRTLETLSHRTQKALFVGDSHMEQYWPRVKYLIDEHPDTARSAVFATYVGCPPLPMVNSARDGWSCDGFFDFVMQQASQGDVDSVVFAAFWEVYFLGEYSTEDSRQEIYQIDDPRRTPLLLESNGTRLAFDQFEVALSALIRHGRRVFIVLSNPTSSLFDPMSRFPIESRLREIASRTGAQIIDPREALCDKMLCPAGSALGTPLYVDSNHVRPFFAIAHAVFLDRILLGTT